MPRKENNIYKRQDGRWEGRYIKSVTHGHKPQYGYVYAYSYDEVLLKLKAASSVDIREQTGDKITLFESIAEQWLKHTACQIKSSSYNKYRNMIKLYILPSFGQVPLSLLTHTFIQEQCNMLLTIGGKDGAGLSPKTVSDVLSIVRRILNYAAQAELEVKCLGQDVRVKQSQHKITILSYQEQKRLVNYILLHQTPIHLGILLSLFAGLRVGEVCALRWEDLSLEDGLLYVSKTMQRIQLNSGSGPKTKVVITEPKSQCSVRHIPLPPEIVYILKNQEKENEGFFLTNSKFKYIEPRTLQNHFKRVLVDCGIKPTNYHCLRHTFATNCVELNFDVKTLSEILGHASVNITMNRYVHPTMEQKRENMSRFSQFLAVK